MRSFLKFNMNTNGYKGGILIGLAVSLLGGARMLADQVRWDFAGNLNTVSGLGSSQPGAAVGATITGSITLPDTSPVRVSSSYPYWAGGTATVFGGAYCTLDYTLVSGGVSYHTAATVSSLDMQIGSAPNSEDNFHFWGGSSIYWFVLSKSGLGAHRPGTFASFLEGTSTGLNDGWGFITLAESNWGNSVNGYLTSFAETIIPVPEPSSLAIICSGATLVAIRARRGTTPNHDRNGGIGSFK